METDILSKLDVKKYNVIVLVDKKIEDWDKDETYDIAVPVRNIFGTDQLTHQDGGALNSLTISTNATAIRVDSFSFPVDSLTLLADSANTAPINIGTQTHLNFPLAAGASVELRSIIPANVWANSTTAQTLHVIYAGGQI